MDTVNNRFSPFCKKKNKEVIFYKVEYSYEILENLGFSLEKIGEDALIYLPNFSIEGSNKSNLRRKIKQAQKQNLSFKILTDDELQKNFNELKLISDDWLNERNDTERGFSVGIMQEWYLKHQKLCVVYKDKKIIAFCTLNITLNKYQASIDLVRHTRDIPVGTMHFLVYSSITFAKQEKIKYFNLCMAPLSGLETERKTIFNLLLLKIYYDFNNKHKFKGLRQFKASFKPSWNSKFIATKRNVITYYSLTRILFRK